MDFNIPSDVKVELPNGFNEKIVRISLGKAGRVIGKGGAKIRSIQNLSGARVTISQHKNSVRIVGRFGEVGKADRMIKHALNGGNGGGGETPSFSGGGGNGETPSFSGGGNDEGKSNVSCKDGKENE